MIRLATRRDIPAIQRVGIDADSRYAAAGRPELADGATIPTAAAERAIARGALLVAEVEGVGAAELAGWVVLGRVDGEWCVGQLSVATSLGRRGVGSALLARVIEDARAAGEPSILLNTEADLPWCAPWYARLGFVVVPRAAWSEALVALAATQTADGLDWATRVHMRLALAAAG